MSKKDSLLRDVEKLLKKYGLADLHDAVSSLKKRKKRKKSKALAAPKRSSNTRLRKSKRQSQVKSASQIRAQSAVSSTRGARRPTTGAGRKLLVGGHAVTIRDIQKVSEKLGGKFGVPEKQRSTTKEPVSRSRKDAHELLARLPRAMIKDRGEDYAKWFRIISGDAGDAKKSDRYSESVSPHLEESKQWKEAITHLRIREFLLSSPFRLRGSSPRVSGTIIFLPDGSIRTARAQLKVGWRLSEGRLELLDEAGTVQSRFVLSNDGRFLMQSEPSVRIQQLIRVDGIK